MVKNCTHVLGDVMNKFLAILGKFSTKLQNLEWMSVMEWSKTLLAVFTFQHFVFMSKLFSFVSKICFYVRITKTVFSPFILGKIIRVFASFSLAGSVVRFLSILIYQCCTVLYIRGILVPVRICTTDLQIRILLFLIEMLGTFKMQLHHSSKKNS
jgi:hypothetical protein